MPIWDMYLMMVRHRISNATELIPPPWSFRQNDFGYNIQFNLILTPMHREENPQFYADTASIYSGFFFANYQPTKNPKVTNV